MDPAIRRTFTWTISGRLWLGHSCEECGLNSVTMRLEDCISSRLPR